MEVSGQRREKQCRGPCKEVKSLYQFSRSKNAKDGRNKYCLACERTRVKNYLAMKAAKAKETVAPISAAPVLEVLPELAVAG